MKMDISIKPVNDKNTHTKAFVSIKFNEDITISGFRIFEYLNKNNELRMAVGMPQRQNKDGEWIDMCKPITAEFRKELEQNVFLTYNPDKQTKGSYGENDEYEFVSARVNQIQSETAPSVPFQ